MILTIVVVLVVLLLMILTVYFLLKGMLSKVNEKGKEFFVLKLSELEQSKKETDKKEEKKEIEKVEEKIVSNVDTNINQNNVILYQSKDLSDFDVKEVLQLVKKIDSKFNYDERYIVEEFVNQTVNDDTSLKYNNLVELKKFINKIGLYKLLRMSESETEKFKCDIIKYDKDILDSYLTINEKFDIEGFISYLDIEIKKNDPIIYVLVGNKNVSFDDVSDKVKTVYKEEVYRGIKIVYRSDIYDYSLG